MDRPTFVIGHKNPDTDSISAAISYAALKNATCTGNYIPKRAGHLNEETHFVLDYFGIQAPEYMKDVRTQVRDIEIRETKGIDRGTSIKKAWAAMTELGVYTLPITEDNKLHGLITTGDVARSYMDVYDNTILSAASTSYKNIIETLEAELVAGDIEGCINKGKVVVAAANPDMMENYIEEGDTVILGNRYAAQVCAVELNAGCLIVCEGASVSKTIIKLAAEIGARIIVTPYDTYTTARLINQSIPVGYFMRTKDIISFKLDDTIDSISDIMTRKRFRDFPITDADGDYVGMISRRNVLGAVKKQIILVDHNEKGQAANGIEDATIVEIIDHHRLGTIETITPVFFRNQPVGSTTTIVYQMYKEHCIVPEKKIAGLMAAAIVSDTLIYRSPTCTPLDVQAAKELAAIAEIDDEEFGKAMFKAGSKIKKAKSIRELIERDYKKFTIGDTTFAIGQVNSMDQEELDAVLPKIIKFMANKASISVTTFFMLTNIMTESSQVVCSDDSACEMIENAFNAVRQDGNVFTLKGVVSRKKQLVPAIIESLKQ